MNRREAILTTGTVVATAFAGCLGDGGGGGEDGGQPDGRDGATAAGGRRTITVSKSGEAEAEPDLAVLRVDVEATGERAADVRSELAGRSDDLRSALIEYGLDEDDVTTERYQIRERIDRRQMEKDGVRPDSPEAEDEYTYYHGIHSFSVEVEAVDEVGEVIDVAVDAGADEIGRVTFTLTDERRAELRERALTRAIEDARAEADHIAEQVGASVVEATIVDASDGRITPIRREAAVAGAVAEDTPTPNEAPTSVDPGDVTVTAEVRIRYTME